MKYSRLTMSNITIAEERDVTDR